ncbi:hypothetical protein PSQ90_06615 [Devosia rhodophyticola]|uniref:Cytosine deaminase n=1 Tax=Devosia rhodophyticola TaxID=3026423 RepID=A0ABY7Z0F1_9HYPH|nr:hypothetical protein [Devosia rhodophyticola]WDR07101.1 hypothetical protein PSQ90_06615 [Devosia rhodophyticola]
MRSKTPFYRLLETQIAGYGGMHNAHAHLDRAGTLDPKYMAGIDLTVLDNSHVSLMRKHSLINNLHAGPAFDVEDLTARAVEYLDAMVDIGTTRVDTMVDVTDDRVQLSALQTLANLRNRYAGKIDLRLGAYTPFGFVDGEPQRWALLEEAVASADFIGCLPEADDIDDYPDHIGFENHCERHLDLALRHKMMLHVHTDQRNEEGERGTERLIEVARVVGTPCADNGDPLVWAVHMISPSTYDERRHRRMVEGLLECNIGVITCPSAAIGMRQLRPLHTPTYNCIPRVLELLEAGVHVRVGTDNIADICSPSTTADLVDEIFVLSAAIRFYQTDILAKLAAGKRLSPEDRAILGEHLAKNEAEIAKVIGENHSFSAQ